MQTAVSKIVIIYFLLCRPQSGEKRLGVSELVELDAIYILPPVHVRGTKHWALGRALPKERVLQIYDSCNSVSRSPILPRTLSAREL